ncbi:MAG: flavin reductase [Clostridia bacterium]|nr:flavin reductase [Clostridia bacterium]
MWTPISPYELNDNIFHLIDKEWMLVTAKDPETGKCNTMTASWGGCGILWNRPVAFVFIRPQRYTMEFIDKNEMLTLSFFSEEHRDALRLCGRVSGRDCDKIADAGLHTADLTDSATGFAEARMTMVCRKLYADVLRKDSFLDESLLSNYTAGDYHNVFICEITEVLKNA